MHTPDFTLYRNGGFDCCDEWVPSNSWSGKTWVVDSLESDLRVTLHVEVWGVGHWPRCWPREWYAKLRCGYQDEVVGRGKCRSLKGVIRAVRALDLTEGVKKVMSKLYMPERAYLVYRREDRPSVWGVLTDRGAWEPWCSFFGYATVAAETWPPGEYLAVRGEEHLMIRRTGCSVCTNSLKAESENFDWLLKGDAHADRGVLLSQNG